jgi:hypothetical protein
VPQCLGYQGQRHTGGIMMVAARCRRSCSRTRGSPACSVRSWKRFSTSVRAQWCPVDPGEHQVIILVALSPLSPFDSPALGLALERSHHPVERPTPAAEVPGHPQRIFKDQPRPHSISDKQQSLIPGRSLTWLVEAVEVQASAGKCKHYTRGTYDHCSTMWTKEDRR